MLKRFSLYALIAACMVGVVQFRHNILTCGRITDQEACAVTSANPYCVELAAITQTQAFMQLGDKFDGYFARSKELSPKKCEDFRKLYEDALVLSDDALFHHNLAWILARCGNYSEAEFHFEQATRLQGDDPVYRLSYALFEEWRGSNTRALDEYTHAVIANPRLYRSGAIRDLELRSPQLYASMRDRLYSFFIANSDNIIANAGFASILLQDGNRKGCSIAEKIEARLESLPAIHLLLAKCDETPGKKSLELRRTLLLDPDNIEADMLFASALTPRFPEYSQKWLQRAITSKQGMSSSHAKLVWSFYHPQSILRNDVVPHALLSLALLPRLPISACGPEFRASLQTSDVFIREMCTN